MRSQGIARREAIGGNARTGEVGGVELVHVDIGDVGSEAAGGDPALEEVKHELLVGGAEAEARRPPPRRRVLHFAGRVGGLLACRLPGQLDPPAT
jgi:hypothetical protein